MNILTDLIPINKPKLPYTRNHYPWCNVRKPFRPKCNCGGTRIYSVPLNLRVTGTPKATNTKKCQFIFKGNEGYYYSASLNKLIDMGEAFVKLDFIKGEIIGSVEVDYGAAVSSSMEFKTKDAVPVLYTPHKEVSSVGEPVNS